MEGLDNFPKGLSLYTKVRISIASYFIRKGFGEFPLQVSLSGQGD